MKIEHLVEKPNSEEAPSRLAILGRYVFNPDFFEYQRNIKEGVGGEIQLTDNQGMSLGIENPKELSTAFTYSRKLTNNLSLGGTTRYIWSNLSGSISNYSDSKSGSSFSVDLGLYYNKEITLLNRTSELSFGSHFSNIGGKITYGSSKNLDFIPINLRFGSALKTFIDQYNSITIALDFNKLLVPITSKILTFFLFIQIKNQAQQLKLIGIIAFVILILFLNFI